MIIEFIKNILFPVECVQCGKEGDWWCVDCLEKNIFAPVLRCPGCGRINQGECCPSCRESCSLDGASAYFDYDDIQPAAKLIREFKYSYARDVVCVWEKIINKSAMPTPVFSVDAVIPVPLHPRRERGRGYNQAEILARIYARAINRESLLRADILTRIRETSQQATLSREERIKNVAGAFVLLEKSIPENIVLVDDVFTTGATLNECARVLKTGGVKNVWAITLARTV